MFSGRRSASTAAEKGETLANCSNSIGKESLVHSHWSRIIQSLLSLVHNNEIFFMYCYASTPMP